MTTNNGIDLEAFKKDYYDPHNKVVDVAHKYGLKEWNISVFVRKNGLKNRREAGIIYLPNGLPSKRDLKNFLEDGTVTGASRHFGISRAAVKRMLADENGVVNLKRHDGCNDRCHNWDFCTTQRPQVLPCEVYFFEDEFAIIDEDPASYYRSPCLETAVKVMG